MKKCPETAPVSGDRVDYYVRTGMEQLNQRGITPEEVDDNTIDYKWYVQKQLKEPLTRLLDMVTTDVNSLFRCNVIMKRVPKHGMGKFVKVLGKRKVTYGNKNVKKKRPTFADVRRFFT